MICIKCKKEIPDGSAFCNWCGKKQAAEKRKSRKRANAQGTVYKLTGNRTKPYIAILPCKYDEDKNASRSILGYYATKTAALNALNEAIASNVTDRINMTLADTFNSWKQTAYRELSAKSIEAYDICFKHLESLHKVKIKDIKADDVQAIIDEKSGAVATCKKIKNLYSQLCKYAMSQDIISQNYAQFLKMPKSEKKEKEIFSIAEIKSLLLHDNDETAMIILILIFTGMRIGELFDIKKENVYLDDVPPRIIGGKKTEAGKNRLIPIHSQILKYIRYFFDKPGEYLISNSQGDRMSENNFRNRFYYPFLENNNIEKKSPHSTRHTFATMLQAKGAKPEDLIRVIGHSDYKTTTENYIHQNIDTLSEMIEMIDIE